MLTPNYSKQWRLYHLMKHRTLRHTWTESQDVKCSYKLRAAATYPVTKTHRLTDPNPETVAQFLLTAVGLSQSRTFPKLRKQITLLQIKHFVTLFTTRHNNYLEPNDSILQRQTPYFCNEPSGCLTNRVAILSAVKRTGTVSALGHLSRRVPYDGGLVGNC